MWQALLRETVRIDISRMDAWVAGRNMVGVLLPLLAGILSGSPHAGLVAATASLVVSYSDGNDPYLYRARRMFASSLICGAAVFLASFSANIPLLASVLAAIWGLCSGISIVLGATAADLGLFSLVMFVIFANNPLSLSASVESGLLSIAGGLLQIALALSLWPIHRYRPERQELAQLFLSLEELARSRVVSKTIPLGSAQMNHAQEYLAGLQRDETVEGMRYCAILNQGERIRLRLVALLRLRKRIRSEEASCEEAKLLDRFLAESAVALRAVSQVLLTGRDLGSPRIVFEAVQRPIDAMRSKSSGRQKTLLAATIRNSILQMEALAGQLRASLDLSQRTTAGGRVMFYQAEARKPGSRRFAGVWATIRANLTLDAIGFRHAIRLAVAIGAGEVLSHSLPWQRSYWLPMTIALVLKPEFSSTLSRGLLRVAGTMAGLLVATAFFHFFDPSIGTQIALIGVCVFLLRWVGTAHYGIFAATVAALIVLMSTVNGASPADLIFARAVYTVAGGLIAIIVYFAWRTPGEAQVSESLAKMLDSYRVYFEEVVETITNPEMHTYSRPLDQARIQTRVTRSNFQASIDKFYGEPETTPEQRSRLSAIQASANRFAYTLMMWDAGEAQKIPPEQRETFRKYASEVGKTLALLVQSLRGGCPSAKEFPDLRERYDELVRIQGPDWEDQVFVQAEADRMTNSLNTLRERVLSRANL